MTPGLSRLAVVDAEIVDTRPTALTDDAAERAVLGALLFDATEAVRIAAPLLVAADFADPRHATLWEAFLAVHARGEHLDIVTASAELRTRKRLNTIGGAQYLGEITDDVHTLAHCESHARLVLEASRRRRLAEIGERLALVARDPSREPEKVRDAVVEALRGLRFGRGATASSALDLVSEAMARIEESLAGRGVTALPFGVGTLDRMSGGGMKRGGCYFIAARPGIGKAQPLDAMVLTPSGFVPMGSLKVGDVVTGSNGLPCRVTGVYPQGVLPVYRVTTSDGAATECCNEHLWFTQTRNERRNGIAGSVKRLADVRRTLKIERGYRINHHIPVVAPVVFDVGTQLPMSPYLLGLLLGDGDFTGGCVKFTNSERDVRDTFRALLPIEDDTSEADEITLRVRRLQRNNERSETMKTIASLGLCGTDCYRKFIPSAYLTASEDDRTWLLRGLFDTDGWVVDGGTSVEFSTSSKEMADGVVTLVRSLGGVVSISPRVPTFTVGGERKTSSAVSYRMMVRFPNGIVPVSSAKHLARWRSRPSRSLGRCIESIEPAGEKECQCIAVDAADHLYVTDGFIVTHNTALACQIGSATAARGEGVLYVALEPSRAEVMQSTIAARAGVELVKLTRDTRLLTQDDLNDITTASNAIAGWPLHVVDASGRETPDTVARIESVMRSLPAMPALVIVDHLLKIQPTRRHERAHEGTGEVVGALVALGKRTGATFLTLCHIGRGVSDRGGLFRRPRAEDIAGGDAMNRDADGIILLHREDKYPTTRENIENPSIAGVVDMFAPKLRGVADNTLGRMRFVGAVQRFEAMEAAQSTAKPTPRAGWKHPDEDLDEPSYQRAAE